MQTIHASTAQSRGSVQEQTALEAGCALTAAVPQVKKAQQAIAEATKDLVEAKKQLDAAQTQHDAAVATVMRSREGAIDEGALDLDTVETVHEKIRCQYEPCCSKCRMAPVGMCLASFVDVGVQVSLFVTPTTGYFHDIWPSTQCFLYYTSTAGPTSCRTHDMKHIRVHEPSLSLFLIFCSLLQWERPPLPLRVCYGPASASSIQAYQLDRRRTCITCLCKKRIRKTCCPLRTGRRTRTRPALDIQFQLRASCEYDEFT